ncbi:replication endonuclease [Ferrovum myxofaciens]|uniref:replication endonuclease n=1 Tax=Ferrovum myxofaciens TaxID=416213 RepID=UPI0023530883|nr:replication endonuclease [Ferrovum myxofaciens]MBU6994778.1 replication endonuclease [Ferrovum myxofaciens]
MSYEPFDKPFTLTDFRWSWFEFYRVTGEDEEGKPIKEFGQVVDGEEIIVNGTTSFRKLWQPKSGESIPIETAGHIKKITRSQRINLIMDGAGWDNRSAASLEKKIMECRDDRELSDLCSTFAKLPALQRLAGYTEEIAAKRLRRHYRQNVKRKLGWFSHNLQQVGGKTGNRCVSAAMLDMRSDQLTRSLDWLSRTSVDLPDLGSYRMDELAKKAKTSRFAETWCKLVGLEKFARESGLIPCFYTVTCPPHLHPNPTVGKNSWNGSLPDESIDFLTQSLRTLRSRLFKKGVVLVGCRFLESCQDGCAHAHGLFWVNPLDRSIIEQEIRKIWNWEGGDEETRAKLKWLYDPLADSTKAASAASYCMKYIMKTLNLKPGETSPDDAWLATWGGRNVDFFGLPTCELWRRLRAATPAEIGGDCWLSLLSRWARDGDYCEFIKMMKGLGCKRKDRPLRVEVHSDGNTKTVSFIRSSHGEENVIALFTKQKATLRTLATWEVTNSQKAQVTLVTELPKKTKPSAHMIELFNERVSILRFDSGFSKRQAWERALREHPPAIWSELERMASQPPVSQSSSADSSWAVGL